MREESTAPDPVELTRSAIASGNDGDYDAMMSFFGPESSVDMTRLGLGSYSGSVAIRRFLENWIGASDEVEFLLDEAVDLGSGVTLASVRQSARPVGTKGLLRFRYYAVYSWVERICLRVTHYREVDEARAAAERLAEERGEAISRQSVRAGIAGPADAPRTRPCSARPSTPRDDGI